jgi:hypothetical protein
VNSLLVFSDTTKPSAPSTRTESLVKEGESLLRSRNMLEDIEQIGATVRDTIFTQNDQIQV